MYKRQGVGGDDMLDGGGDSDRCVGGEGPIQNCEFEQINEAITVAVLGDEPFEQIAELSPIFQAQTGIDVDFVVLEAEFLREVVFQGSNGFDEVARGFDAVMIGPFEAPQFGVNGWIQDLTEFAEADADYNVDDILEPFRDANSVDGELYALPFYGESSFIMYNRDIMDAAGIVVPDNPTWDEIAAIAAAVHTDDVAGICLRGLPGWGDFGASLTAVVNTFGGTWWEANADGTPGEPQINQADSAFRAATEFYVDLVQTYGEDDPATTSFPQCLELMEQGRAAMWYDATFAADILGSDDSPLPGNLGVALAPTGPAGLAGGWQWTWSFAIPVGAEKTELAWEFIRWSTSEEFIDLLGEQEGWDRVFGPVRLSTYENPEYIAAKESFSDVALEQILSTDPLNPGLTPRPGTPGVQFVGIPEFQGVGNACTTQIALAIAGDLSVDQALDDCQEIASAVSVIR